MSANGQAQPVNIDELLLCPQVAKEDLMLYTSSKREYPIKKGERIFLPKHIEVLKAVEKGFKHIFFGGALGGGKSHLLRGLAIRRLVYWASLGYNGVHVALCSETFPTLRRRHINVLKTFPDWLGKYKVADQEYVLREEFGSGVINLLNLDDASKYASDEYADIFIEELTFNTEDTYNALAQRKRWVDKPSGDMIEDGVMVSASNPGRIGHSWTYDRWVNPKTRDKYPDHCFIQSLPTDNPFLPKSYYEDLRRTLPAKVARALLDGDWTVFEGQYFTNLEEAVHFIPPFPIPPHWNRFRAIDDGYNHPAVCLWGAVNEYGDLYVYREHSVTHRTTEWHKEQIALASGNETYRFTVVDPSLKRVNGTTQGGKTPFEVYNANDDWGSFRCIIADRERVAGWRALLNAFQYEYDDKGEGFKVAPKVYIFNTCPNTWSSLRGLTYDEKKVEDVQKSKGTYAPGQGDDEAEALRYMYFYCKNSGELTVPEEETHRPSQVQRNTLMSDNPYVGDSSGGLYSSGF